MTNQPCFTPNMLRAHQLGWRLRLRALPELVGTRAEVTSVDDGLARLTYLLTQQVGLVECIDDAARQIVVATLQKYDFADVRVTMGAEVLRSLAPPAGIRALREMGLFPDRQFSDVRDEELDASVLSAYEDSIISDRAVVHVFARAQRSASTSRNHDTQSRLPAILEIERAYVANSTMSPWAFSYL